MEPFKVFTQRVFETYQSMKGGSKLATELENPTGPKLRDQCLIILADKTRKEDHQVIKEFYDPKNVIEDLEVHIKKENPDIFKALINFMKQKVSPRDEKNVKLLAALTAFEPRPYSEWYKSYQEELQRAKEPVDPPLAPPSDTENVKDEGTLADNVTSPVDEVSNQGAVPPMQANSWMSLKTKIALFLLFAASCIGIGFYTQTDKSDTSSVNGCMIWTVEQYKPIPCKPKTGNILVIALDTTKVRSFRKVMRTDTISYNSIGVLWYSKIDNQVEFFTGSGNHPVYHLKKLKPVTMHIIDTYVKTHRSSLTKK